MSNAPRNRLLATRIRDLVWESYTTKTPRVVFLGQRGEVRDLRHPSQGDVGSLLAERASLLEAGELGAVVYLSPLAMEHPWVTTQLSLTEFYDADGTRSGTSLIVSVPGSYRWFPASAENVDQWLDQFNPSSDRKEDPPEKSPPDKP